VNERDAAIARAEKAETERCREAAEVHMTQGMLALATAERDAAIARADKAEADRDEAQRERLSALAERDDAWRENTDPQVVAELAAAIARADKAEAGWADSIRLRVAADFHYEKQIDAALASAAAMRAALEKIGTKVAEQTDDEDLVCRRCGDGYHLGDGLEPTPYCNGCAHALIEAHVEIARAALRDTAGGEEKP
jgi:hypothetical protein